MSIEWISVTDRLPGEGIFLCIVKFIESVGIPGASATRPNHIVMDVNFDPRTGWDFKYCPPNSKVIYWTEAEMSIPNAI